MCDPYSCSLASESCLDKSELRAWPLYKWSTPHAGRGFLPCLQAAVVHVYFMPYLTRLVCLSWSSGCNYGCDCFIILSLLSSLKIAVSVPTYFTSFSSTGVSVACGHCTTSFTCFANTERYELIGTDDVFVYNNASITAADICNE